MAVSTTTRILIAGVVVLTLVVVAVMLWQPVSDDGDRAAGPQMTLTTVVLVDDPSGSGCVIKSKEKQILVKAGRQVVWELDKTGCHDPDELVTVGNFRESAASTSTDCLAATHGPDGIWLFAQPEDLPHRQSTTRIQLTARGPSEIAAKTYYYDICAGRQAEKRADPRLVIEH